MGCEGKGKRKGYRDRLHDNPPMEKRLWVRDAVQIAGYRSCQHGNRSVREESVMSCSAEQDQNDSVAAKEPKDKPLV